ncbi:MAG TPA: GrlR family regulatory protein, partial [Chroococcales cyanobacterium]
MVEGFYTAKFRTHESVEGAGIVVMKDGKLIGGDNAYKYVGSYGEHENQIKVEVTAQRFAPGISVFGDHDELHFTLIATVKGNGVSFAGTLLDAPEQKIEVILERQ